MVSLFYFVFNNIFHPQRIVSHYIKQEFIWPSKCKMDSVWAFSDNNPSKCKMDSVWAFSDNNPSKCKMDSLWAFSDNNPSKCKMDTFSDNNVGYLCILC